MGNFISDQLTKYLNQRLDRIGSVDSLEIATGSLKATLNLRGEEVPIRLEFSGIYWNSEDGKFNLHYDRACASREWIQAVFDYVGEKSGKVLTIPDTISLMPLKMLFEKSK